MSTPQTKGLVLHSEARYYDLLAWTLTLGREHALRERLADLAQLKPGDAVLDTGCGTGTLAITAKRRVGASGTVHGIDAAPEMIDRATRKAAKAGLEVAFQTAVAEGLPFPDSLCHRCAAPPKYIRTERSVFIRCPIFRAYPPQPVSVCEAFVPRETAETEGRPG